MATTGRPRGRPKKKGVLSSDVLKEAKALRDKELREGTIKNSLTTSTNDPMATEKFKCTCCGKQKHYNEFYLNNRSEMLKGNYYRIPVCSDCINDLFKRISDDYGDERIATEVCCHLSDTPFIEEMCDRLMELDTPTFGKYLKYINLKPYENRSYSRDIIQNFNAAEREALYEKDAKGWGDGELKNKLRVVRALGGEDPFEDCKDEDRRYMFNLCAEYFMDESLLDDPHKTQGVVEIVKTYKDIRSVGRLIDKEIRNGSAKSGQINEIKLNKLTTIKKDLMELINKFAKENGISATLSSKGTKGTGSLSYHIKALDEMDFTEAKVNLFDIATCEGMRQVADISNQSVWNQIQLSDDEKDELLLTQSKALTKSNRKVKSLQEELRLTKIRLSKYEEVSDSQIEDSEDEIIEVEANNIESDGETE